MSRSYKKTPGFTDQQRNSSTSKVLKRLSNKRVRQFDVEDHLPNGKAYRKFLDPWDICDWKLLYFSDKELEDDIQRGILVDKKYHFYMK